ncbi:MAG: hypothetical protein H6737_31500 [Alphaproteobacteria bacterium]|nr:hypothetical protein [Alphaproteobacteria bacterium]
MRRALRGIERTMVEVGPLMGPDVVVGCFDGPLDPAILRRAVARLQMQHAALRCRVEGDSLVVGGPVPVSVDVVDGDWRWHAEAELGRPLRLHEGEAMRVVLAPGAVVLSVHHALVDGTSLLRLLRDLLTHCEALVDGTAGVVMCEPLAPAVLDSVQGAVWHDWVGPIAGWLAPYVVEHDQRTLLGEGVAEGPVRSVCAFGEGTRAGLERLAAACRAHDVTVGGAAMAAASYTVAGLRAERSGVLAPVAVEVEVDLRRRAVPALPSDRVGFHTGGVRTSTPPSDLDFWGLATWLKDDVERDIRHGLPRFAHALAEHLDWQPRHVPGAWVGVSNLGRFPHRMQYGAVRLTGVYGFNGAVPGGPAVMLWLRCVDGRLCFNAVGSAPTVSADELDALGRTFLDMLEHPSALRLADWAGARRAA